MGHPEWLCAAMSNQHERTGQAATTHAYLTPSATTCLFGRVAGSSSAELAPFLDLFARQLLGPQHRWASTTWSILEAVVLPAAAVSEAWQLLLAAAVQCEGPTFMPGE
jgi:hypothetical protein